VTKFDGEKNSLKNQKNLTNLSSVYEIHVYDEIAES
jgi:hypothetical protein